MKNYLPLLGSSTPRWGWVEPDFSRIETGPHFPWSDTDGAGPGFNPTVALDWEDMPDNVLPHEPSAQTLYNFALNTKEFRIQASMTVGADSFTIDETFGIGVETTVEEDGGRTVTTSRAAITERGYSGSDLQAIDDTTFRYTERNGAATTYEYFELYFRILNSALLDQGATRHPNGPFDEFKLQPNVAVAMMMDDNVSGALDPMNWRGIRAGNGELSRTSYFGNESWFISTDMTLMGIQTLAQYADDESHHGSPPGSSGGAPDSFSLSLTPLTLWGTGEWG